MLSLETPDLRLNPELANVVESLKYATQEWTEQDPLVLSLIAFLLEEAYGDAE